MTASHTFTPSTTMSSRPLLPSLVGHWLNICQLEEQPLHIRYVPFSLSLSASIFPVSPLPLSLSLFLIVRPAFDFSHFFFLSLSLPSLSSFFVFVVLHSGSVVFVQSVVNFACWSK